MLMLYTVVAKNVAGLARVSKHVTLPTLQKQLVPPSMSNCGGNCDRGPGSFL